MSKKTAFLIPLALCLLICAGCSQPSGGGAEQTAPEETETVSVDPKDYGITDAMLAFEEPVDVSELSLEALGAFFLHTDGAGAEGSGDELYRRFMNDPDAVLNYMAKIDGDSAKALCQEIAYADVIWYDATDAFAAILEERPESAQSAGITALLETLRSEREAALAQGEN